jgi:type IX secretion system PorP/SprF family membrane protein
MRRIFKTMKKSILWIFSFISAISMVAQDVQFSQYYNAPLYLNPAFTGSGLDTRVGANYRMQWPGVANPYRAFSVWADHDFYKAKSGVGFMLKQDVQGADKLRTTEASLLYSYQINLSDRWTLKPGIQAGFGARSNDLGQATFGDQLTNNGNTGTATNDPLATQGRTIYYPDISSGAIAYNRHMWFGFSAHHLNRPNHSFVANQDSRLPIKWSLIGGYRIVLQQRQIAWGAPTRETSLTPTFLFKQQGPAQQLDLGVYLIHNPFMAGLWYRGLPLKKVGSIRQHESLVLMAGINHNGLTIGYSYDMLVSSLSGIGSGAHELTLIYQWQIDKSNRKGKQTHRPMPCPNVDRQYKNFRQ